MFLEVPEAHHHHQPRNHLRSGLTAGLRQKTFLSLLVRLAVARAGEAAAAVPNRKEVPTKFQFQRQEVEHL